MGLSLKSITKASPASIVKAANNAGTSAVDRINKGLSSNPVTAPLTKADPFLFNLGSSSGEAINKALTSGNTGDLFKTVQNNASGNGAAGQHSDAAQISRANAEIQPVQDFSWGSMVDPATGQLNSKYQLQAPGAVKADTYSAGTLTGNYGVSDPSKVTSGSVYDTAKGLYDPIQGNEASMQAYRDRALQQGPSPWLTMQQNAQRLGEEDALQKSASTGQGNLNNAMSALALRGGLSGGAAQRLAHAQTRDNMLGQQDIRRQGLGDRLNLSIADENTKNDFLKSLPAAEVAWLQPQLAKAAALTSVKTDDTNRAFDASKFDIANSMNTNQFNANQLFSKDQYNTSSLNDANKFNIGNKFTSDQFNTDALFKTNQYNNTNLLNEMQAGRNADLEKWKTQMAATGADKTANAMANAGKK